MAINAKRLGFFFYLRARHKNCYVLQLMSKAKCIFLIHSLSALFFLSGCYTLAPEKADALQKSRQPDPETKEPASLKADIIVTESALSVLPDNLSLQTGERGTIAFSLSRPAQEGGLYLNITTNIPESVIMPEVTIPEGSRSVSASILAGNPGEGILSIEADGYERTEVTIRID